MTTEVYFHLLQVALTLADIKIPVPVGLLVAIGLVVATAGLYVIVIAIASLFSGGGDKIGGSSPMPGMVQTTPSSQDLSTAIESAVWKVAHRIKKGEQPRPPDSQLRHEDKVMTVAFVALQVALNPEDGSESSIRKALSGTGLPSSALMSISSAAYRAAKSIRKDNEEKQLKSIESKVEQLMLSIITEDDHRPPTLEQEDPSISTDEESALRALAILILNVATGIRSGAIDKQDSTNKICEMTDLPKATVESLTQNASYLIESARN